MSKTASIGVLSLTGMMNISSISKGLDTLRAKINGFAGGISKLGGGLVGLGAGLGAIAGTSAAVSAAMDVEDRTVELGKAANLSGDALQGFRDEIVDMGAEMRGIRTDELFGIATAGARIGIAQPQLTKYTKTIAQLATIFDGMSAEDISENMGILTGIFDLEATDGANRLGSAIDALADASASSGAEIISTLQDMGGNANSLGLAATDAASLATALLNTGTSSQKAASSLGKMFLTIADGTKSQDFAKLLGVSEADFKTMLQDSPMKAVEGFLKQLQGKDLTDVFSILQSVGITGIEDIGAINKLKDQVDKLGDFTSLANAEFDKGTRALDGYTASSDTTRAKLDQFMNILTKLSVQIGDVLLPILSGALLAIMPVVTVITNLFKDLFGGLRDGFAASSKTSNDWNLGIGEGLRSVGGFFVSLYDNVRFVFRNIADVLEIATIQATQVFMNIGAVIATFPANLLLIGKWLGSNWLNLISDAFSGALTIVENYWANLRKLFSAGWEFIKTGKFDVQLTPLMEGFESVTEQLPEMVKPEFVSLENDIMAVADRIAARELKTSIDIKKEADSVIPVPETQLATDTTTPSNQPTESRLASNIQFGSAEAFKAINSFRAGFEKNDSQDQTAKNTKEANKHLSVIARKISNLEIQEASI